MIINFQLIGNLKIMNLILFSKTYNVGIFIHEMCELFYLKVMINHFI